jgi:hypothetical protein
LTFLAGFFVGLATGFVFGISMVAILAMNKIEDLEREVKKLKRTYESNWRRERIRP